jgi:hypothetical protein
LELGFSATALASINSTSFRTLAGVASGQISVSNFYGKSNAVGSISYVFTNSNLSNQSTGSGVDSSGNFWAISDAIQNGSFGKILIQKWNSTNVWQSSKLLAFSATSPMTTPFYLNAGGGQQVVGYDGYLYAIGTQPGSQSNRNLTGTALLKFDSTGAFVNGKNYYLYVSDFEGGPTIYCSTNSKAVAIDASGNRYFCPTTGLIYLSGYDCCGNPNYSVTYVKGIATADSAGNLGTVYTQANVPGQAGSTADYYTITASNGTNYFCTSMQVPTQGGFVTRISQRTGTSSSVNWSYTYRASIPVLGQSGYIQNNQGSSCTVDNAGAVIAVDFNNYRLMKVDSSGTYQWGAQFEFVNFYYENRNSGVAVDSSNNIYLCGEVNNNPSDATYVKCIAVLKLNSSGVVQWARVISSLTTPTITGTNRQLRWPSIQTRGSDIVVTFGTKSSDRASMTVVYPQSGSFTGNVTVNYTGGYYTINIASLGVTTYNWTYDNRVTQSTSLPSAGYSYSTVNVGNSSVETLTPTPTLVSF